MAYAERFEDLQIWQKARELNKAIGSVCSSGDWARDWDSRSQIRRASLSIMSNIAEGFGRGNKGDFHRFLSIANGSCAEVQCQLYAAYDDTYISQSQFQELLEQAQELGKMIGGLRIAVYKQWRSSN